VFLPHTVLLAPARQMHRIAQVVKRAAARKSV
jgi:hypothetical protein